MIGPGRATFAAADALVTPISLSDAQPINDRAVLAPRALLLSSQLESSGTSDEYSDITSIGVAGNSTALSSGLSSIYSRQSNGAAPGSIVHAMDNTQLSEPSHNAFATTLTGPIAWVDTRTVASTPPANTNVPPTGSDAVASAPPTTGKLNDKSKPGTHPARAGNLNPINGQSTRLIGALLACALMLRRPRRCARS
jgi:hypothetical protein